jgi:hypothetical protein
VKLESPASAKAGAKRQREVSGKLGERYSDVPKVRRWPAMTLTAHVAPPITHTTVSSRA